MTDALLLDRDLALRKGRLNVPEPLPGELVVRVDWSGVCSCDLRVLRTGERVARWPAMLGHEVAGTVESCPGGELPAGSLVVIDPREQAHPGGFAGHVLTGSGQVVPCPDGLEAAIAALAEPLAVAMHAVSRVPGPPERAAIFGYGPIGALVHLEITRRWPEAGVAVVEPEASRRELASAFGADVPSQRELAAWCPDLVVDAAGYPSALADALALCPDGGTVLAVALGHGPVPVVPAGLAGLVGREITLAGSMGFSGELADAVAVLAADPDRYRPVITDAILMDEAPGRLPGLLRSPSPGKVLIRP
jgi:threonine dehydrogenase-like Zn-dependent dehydrogenase